MKLRARPVCSPVRRIGPAILLPLACLAACQGAPPAPTTGAAPAPAVAPATPAAVAQRHAVASDASEIRLLVYRAGPLARVGHSHVVVGTARGEIRVGTDAAASGFSLEIPVASFDVDPPAARAEEGEEFATQISAQGREATRQNMLGKDVLDAERFPAIRIESVALSGPRWAPAVSAEVTLRGVTRAVRFPAAVFASGDAITAIATFEIRQTEFGITPYSALGGGLQVRDAIEVRARIVARR